MVKGKKGSFFQVYDEYDQEMFDQDYELKRKYGGRIETLEGCLELLEVFERTQQYDDEYFKIFENFNILLKNPEIDKKTIEIYRERFRAISEKFQDNHPVEVNHIKTKMKQHPKNIEYRSDYPIETSKGFLVVGRGEYLNDKKSNHSS
jgi:hypothetical protein